MAKTTSGNKTKKVTEKSENISEATTLPSPVVVLEPVVIPSTTPSTLPVEDITAVDSSLEVLEESNTEILFNKLTIQFQDIQTVMKTLYSNLKILQKEVLRERKEFKKKSDKIKKKSDKKRSPSGFAKPSPITNELCEFLGVENNTELARTEVTSKVIAYVKEENLQNPENKKQIILNDKLNKLLQPAPEDVVTFFNLQTYLKKHFISNTVTTEPVTVV
jgi:chromatin remodeling complex protein RSC6